MILCFSFAGFFGLKISTVFAEDDLNSEEARENSFLRANVFCLTDALRACRCA